MRCTTLEVCDNLSLIYETKRGIGFLASFFANANQNASQEPSPTCTHVSLLYVVSTERCVTQVPPKDQSVRSVDKVELWIMWISL